MIWRRAIALKTFSVSPECYPLFMVDAQNNRDVMVSFSELELANKIGSGAAGTVWRGAWRGAAVAVKVGFTTVG